MATLSQALNKAKAAKRQVDVARGRRPSPLVTRAQRPRRKAR